MADGEHARVGVTVGINYNSFFDAKFRLDLPVSKLINDFGGGSSQVELPSYEATKAKEGETFTYHSNKGEGTKYDGVEIKQEIAIDASGIPGVETLAGQYSEISIGNFGDTGGIIIEVSEDGKIQVASDNDYLLDALENAREEDGSLKIDIGEPEPIVVDKEQISIVCFHNVYQ